MGLRGDPLGPPFSTYLGASIRRTSDRQLSGYLPGAPRTPALRQLALLTQYLTGGQLMQARKHRSPAGAYPVVLVFAGDPGLQAGHQSGSFQ